MNHLGNGKNTDTSIYSLFDNYIKYTEACFPRMLDNYMKLYGKSAFLLLMNQNNGKDSDDYIVAFSKSNMSYDFNDPRFFHYPVKILVAYEEWSKVTTGIDMTIQLYLIQNDRYTHQGYKPTIQTGDILTFITQGQQYFYRIDQVPDTYMGVLFRCSLKMASKKDIDNRIERGRVISQPLNIPKNYSWDAENLDNINTVVAPMPDDYGVGDKKYTKDVLVIAKEGKPVEATDAAFTVGLSNEDHGTTIASVDEYGNIVYN